MTVTFDTSILSAYYQAKAGLSLANNGAQSSGSSSSTKKAPTAPWSTRSATPTPPASELVRSVMAGGKFINPSAAKLDVNTSSDDYRKLFSLYQGLSALQGIADQIGANGVGETEKARMRTRFAEGLKELGAYIDTSTFDAFQLAQGTVTARGTGASGVKRETGVYNTGILHTGAADTPVTAFQGAVQFSITAEMVPVAGQPPTSTKVVNFDLAEMGATARTMSNVVLYLNGKLEAQGVATRFANVRTAGLPQTIQAGGQSIPNGIAPDTFALQIKGVSTEHIEFAAASQGPAVYLAGGVGGSATVSAARQLVKYETTASGATTAADGKVYAKTLSKEVGAVRQTVTGSDGSVYMLADVTDATGGQAIKSNGDVALLKYDSAGNLVFTRTLGAANTASGYALALSGDGSRVAVAGSVTGALDNGEVGADAKTTDSFLAVFDAEGDTVFSDRRGATAADQVSSVAFGDDGSVYVAGTSSSAMTGTTAIGGQDNYIRGYKPAAVGAPAAFTTAFTTQYGTTGLDKQSGVAINGSTMVVAGVENGQAVLRRYDLQPTGAPILGQTRDLGPALKGGIAGVSFAADGSVIVAGHTSDGAVSAGTVTTPYASGQSVFVAKLAGDLVAAGTDRLSFYGGGDRTASALTIAGGQVYVAGQIKTTPPPGVTAAFDGYAAAIDPTTGAVGWSKQYQGLEKQAAPTAIAVDLTGASVLDRLGLPKGEIDWTGSPLVVANSSARPGDQFYVRVGRGSSKAVTIEAADTLKTLADKINRALSFTAKVEVVIDKGYDRLQITPLNSRNPIEIEAGKVGRDALRALGLPEGLLATAPDPKKKDDPQYGLQLSAGLNLDNEGRVKQAQAGLMSALSTVRSIYREMTAPPPSKAKAGGEVPAYLTNQIANYQNALNRLTGGQ